VSFDFDHDAKMARLLSYQSKLPAAPFAAENWSLKEAAAERDWLVNAAARIKRCDVVLVLVGPHTHRAQGVLKEVAVARKLGVRVVQVKSAGTMGKPVPDAGRLYLWTFENLSKLLASPRVVVRARRRAA
jgi:hypothetical protein